MQQIGMHRVCKIMMILAVMCYGLSRVTCSHAQTLTSVAKQDRSWNKIDGCPVFAIDAIELPAQETGVLAEFDLQPGSEVKKGQSIAKIDASVVLMEEGVAMSNAALAREVANDTTDEGFAEAVLKEANIALENSKELDRTGAGSKQELRSKQLAVEQANLKLQQTKLARKQLLAKADLAFKSLDAIRQRLKKFEVIAPFEGQLTKINKRAGEWVQIGDSVAQLVRLSELRVDAFVPMQGQHPSKLIGRHVWVNLPGVETNTVRRFGGVVTHFDPEVTSAGTVRIHATVQNQKHEEYWLLMPGMLVSLEIVE